MIQNKKSFILLALAFTLAGCGAASVSTPLTVSYNPSTILESKAVPPASAFKTVEAEVQKILPEDNSGLTHQNFIVIGKDGKTYTVNNSTTHGSAVAGLKVGLSLTIKGTTYKNGANFGLHWTHKANKPGDAGWIKTPDGKIYE
ncbi:MAG TPA: hypothetical protein DD435_02115 [Cyanobacteria bacterium UBA8530]|nr:hypothetical protein [Cyanobacteria bacterium UBA8530]